MPGSKAAGKKQGATQRQFLGKGNSRIVVSNVSFLFELSWFFMMFPDVFMFFFDVSS